MGCFLACFGGSVKRKSRKHAHRILARDQRHGSYEPLDSYVRIDLDVAGNPGSEFREKAKERPSVKVRKKVRFDLNVKTYEPILSDYQILESDEEEKKVKSGEEKSTSFSEGDSGVLRTALFPSNHRYQNCTDNYYDEDDEIEFEESDLDFEDIDDDDEDEDGGNGVCDENVVRDELADDDKNNSLWKGRNKSCYAHSVLIPIENITQWKAVKARVADNQSKHPMQEIQLDASLSNWLSLQHSNQCQNTLINNSSTTKNMWDKSNSWMLREDTTILKSPIIT